MRDYFPKLVGNDDNKKRLCAAVLKGTLPHALLFAGAAGSGKRTLARELSAAINCENRHSEAHSLPCHTCNTCRRIEAGLFTDIHYVRREPKKMSLGVAEIHAAYEDMILTSTESEHRVYIIEEAERLTPQGQNALLKTLEEPPDGVIIILLANETDKILSTVKSRVQTLTMEKFDTGRLSAAVTKRSEAARRAEAADAESFRGMLLTADGRIGRALQLFDDGREAELVRERRELTERFAAALAQSTPYREFYAVQKELPTERGALTEALEEILTALRDLLVIKYDGRAPLIFFPSAKRAAELSERISAKRLIAVSNIINETLASNASNANVGAELAALGARIRLI